MRTVIRLLPAFTIGVAAILAGCSVEGELTIVNDSTQEFWGKLNDQPIILDEGQSTTQTIYIGKSSGLIGPDELEVRIAGSTWTKRPFSELIAVKKDDNTVYRIIDDAGSIFFENDSHLQVNQVRVKGCSETEFGPNLIPRNSVLNPADGILVQLDPGCYDFYVNYGREELLDTVSADTDIGQVINLYWSP